MKTETETGRDVIIGVTRCFNGNEWFREITVEGVTFLAPLEQQEKARHILSDKRRVAASR